MSFNHNRDFPNAPKVRLGDYIKRSTVNNKDERYGIELIEGVTNEGVFSQPKGNPMDVDLKPYKIVNNGAFVYNPSRLDLGSIAYRTDGLCIVSHLYIVFYLNDEGKKKIDPDWLFMYFRRDEFYREVTFRNFGSQRPEFNFNDMSDIMIPLPDISVQRKHVAIYKTMVANQQSYERGLEDLKLVCDGYIEDLRKKMPCESIGKYIQQRNERNSDNYINFVMGLSTKKEFREAQSRVNRDELGNYKIVNPYDIAFVPTTDTWKVLAFAVNRFDKPLVVSPIYEVFSVDKTKLLSQYLAIWLSRKEFDRYARFNSWGSARENFSFEDMQSVQIPVPEISVQKAIVDMYNTYIMRKEINEQLKAQIKDICPILIRGSLEEGKTQ